MRITIFGSGHVGLVTRVCLAELGNQVTYIDEDKLIKSAKPLLNSNTIWKPHALLLIGDYFSSKNENIKAKEFYNKIFTIKNVPNDIVNHAKLQIALISNE